MNHVLSMLLLALISTAVHAHKLHLFAEVSDNMIQGYAYAAGGNRISQATISIMNGSREVGNCTTNEKGEFIHRIMGGFSHRLVLKTGDAHTAEYVVDVPDDMEKTTSVPGLQASKSSELTELRREVSALREGIERDRAETGFRDIFGAIGYIFGVMGLVMYVKSRRGKTA
jgi:nickel transport protein